MENTLLDNLLAFYREDPQDPFNIYALALEYLKSDPNESRQLFEQLLKDFPDYLPTYYHAANFYATLEKIEEAERIYEAGIALAEKLGQQKPKQELINAYRNFLDELED
ncbi:hypothetical protein CLV98_11025 [Dyadobacter jejuensis]|uniref:Tetratricopeptide repeat protein n=1 Tax=Dyadobacter jejuensis TaxID=1082580 RepID=A0A316AIC4_9BACT|nr:tetratricopeptide repeat protein [Dyadobacter jejuensis]PWJ56714.1 hypothetical protein CLV98_11025 [Dyadobacter jejuensis]